jgi:DNA primase
LLCIDNSLYRVIKDKIDPEFFESEENRKIAEIVFNRFREKKGMVPAELINIVGEDTGSFARLIQGECNFEDNMKAILDIIKKMEVYKLEIRQKKILEILPSASKEDAEKLKLELQSILIKKKSI